MSLINSRQLDSAANWDSEGRKKLRQFGMFILNNFQNTDVGEEILSRIDQLEEDIFKRLGRDVVYATIGPEDDSDQLVITLRAVSEEDEDEFYNEYFVEARLVLDNNGQETGFGVALQADVPVDSMTGTTTVSLYEGNGTPISTTIEESTGQSISPTSATSYIVVDIVASVKIDPDTDTDLNLALIGSPLGMGSVLTGSYISARVKAPAPIEGPDPMPL